MQVLSFVPGRLEVEDGVTVRHVQAACAHVAHDERVEPAAAEELHDALPAGGVLVTVQVAHLQAAGAQLEVHILAHDHMVDTFGGAGSHFWWSNINGTFPIRLPLGSRQQALRKS